MWALPTPGGPDDFPRLVEVVTSNGPSRASSGAARTLWEIRRRLGELFSWDNPDTGVGGRVATLRDRMPADLREASGGPSFGAITFTPMYLLDDEFAAEVANSTMHGVLHLGWVPVGGGGYRGQMAILAKPNGVLGKGYMTAIRPFRHRIVYPPMIREIGQAWGHP